MRLAQNTAACLVFTALTGCGQFVLGVEPQDLGGVVLAELPQGVVVVDARTEEQYADGHVPGAARVHWTELTGFTEEGLWDILPTDELVSLMQDRGIPDDVPLVIYGSGPEGWGDDGNVYWVLRYLGHPSVHVLDGGYLGWLAEGETPSMREDGPPPSDFQAQVDPSVRATTEQVATWDGVLLDVRSPEEWSEGHIPGATWYAWDGVFTPEGTLRTADTLAAEFASLGIEEQTPVAVYCAAGIRAGHTFLVLEALGLPSVRNYVGSWARWTAEGGAIEGGDEPEQDLE